MCYLCVIHYLCVGVGVATNLTPMSSLHPTAVVQKVNSLIEKGDYGRLFAIVHFASRQWKVTNEDLILIENHIDAECGERIRMEKVCVTVIVLCFSFSYIGSMPRTAVILFCKGEVQQEE